MNYSDRELALMADTDVLGHIQKRNAEMDAQAKAEGWQFWMGPCESLADRYANMYEYMHDGACADFSDFYKELHGIRPRWVRTSEMRLEEVEALCAELSEEADRMERARAQNAEDFRIWMEEQNALERAANLEAADRLEWQETQGVWYQVQDDLMGF